MNVCFAENLVQLRWCIDNYYAAVGDDGFWGPSFGRSGRAAEVDAERCSACFQDLPVRQAKRVCSGGPCWVIAIQTMTKNVVRFLPSWSKKMAGSSQMIGSFSCVRARPPPPVHISRFRTLFRDDSHLLPRRLHACWRGMLVFSE